MVVEMRDEAATDRSMGIVGFDAEADIPTMNGTMSIRMCRMPIIQRLLQAATVGATFIIE